mgnify:CR=1 FL=1
MTYTAPLLTSLGHLADFILSLPATFGIKDSAHDVEFQIQADWNDIQWGSHCKDLDDGTHDHRYPVVKTLRIHRAGSPGFYGRRITPQELVNLINTSEIEARFADNEARYSWVGGEGEHRAVGHKWAIDILSDDDDDDDDRQRGRRIAEMSQFKAELAAERRVHALRVAFEAFAADPSKATQDALNRAALDYRLPGFTTEGA